MIGEFFEQIIDFLALLTGDGRFSARIFDGIDNLHIFFHAQHTELEQFIDECLMLLWCDKEVLVLHHEKGVFVPRNVLFDALNLRVLDFEVLIAVWIFDEFNLICLCVVDHCHGG